ncbi:hypothetical protein J2X06_000079 [Lysobacter niastensis]|uniref:Uncharacterized protein n=1 Tax=Lysobacter niastensis TaxID=380629 RepID=A0ABU1W6B2_9GAMM|nr:hypothetical protein [Lysobacter niastensis]
MTLYLGASHQVASQAGVTGVRGWRAFVASHHDILHMAACGAMS